MTTKKFYGYQGFTPCHLVHPPASKYPREFLMNKYSSVGQGQVYKKNIISGALNFDDRTLNEDSFVVEAGDFKRTDRRGVSGNHESEDVRTRSKKFLGTTMYNSTFRNFTAESLSITRLPISAYVEPWSALEDSSGTISLQEIPKLLSLAVDGANSTNTSYTAPDWIAIKFLKTFDASPTGRFTFADLESSLPTILSAIKNDTRKNVAGAPEWLTASKKMPPKVLTNSGMKSAMQIDMGMAGDNPADRPYTNKTGMFSTSQDMLAGTTRDTYHIPGYAGHIPASKRNPIVMLQGEMKEPRPIKNNLRLIYSHDLPGYTGHQPKAARNDIGRNKGGLDPRTTSGSAACGMDIL